MGKLNLGSHLELTKTSETINFNFGEKDYLVLYCKNEIEYQEILNRISENKIEFIKSKKPFRNKNRKKLAFLS